jgi:hypothetical protein
VKKAYQDSKARKARGFKGINIKDLSKLFKRKNIQPPTPSGVKGAAAGAAATKPKAEAPKTKPQSTGGNVTGGNRAGSPGSTKNPTTPKAEKAPITKSQRVGGRVKSSSPGGAASQQQKIKDEIASLKTKIKNTTSGKVKGKLQKRLESLQAKLK